MHPDIYDEVYDPWKQEYIKNKKYVPWDTYMVLYQAHIKRIENDKKYYLWLIEHIDELATQSKEDRIIKYHKKIKELDIALDFLNINFQQAKEGVTNG